MGSSVDLVLAYIKATQRARASQDPADFEAIRRFLSDHVEIRLASPWTEDPGRTPHTGADAVIDLLRAGVNARSRLTTDTRVRTYRNDAGLPAG